MSRALPWFRVDTNIAQHDKILTVLTRFSDRNRGKAVVFTYVCALAYAAGNGTDGLIPFPALPFLHGTKRDMEILVEADLLIPHPAGWTIKNFTERQPLAAVNAEMSRQRSNAAAKGNCVRWHDPGCECWKDSAA